MTTHPPQQWHPPQSPQLPQPSRVGGKTTAIIVAAVTVFLLLYGALATGIYLATRPPQGDGASPEAVVAEYLEALDRGDCARAAELLSDEYLSAAGTTRAAEAADCRRVDALPENEGATLVVDSTRLVSQEGDTAVVQARFTLDVPSSGSSPVTQTWDYVLRREDGRWLVADVSE